MNEKVTLNEEQRLYVIPSGKGYSCLGFDVCEQRIAGLERELGAVPAPEPAGTLARYAQYRKLCDTAFEHNRRTGWRSQSELTPQLIGLEGKRVELEDDWGVRRFWVGRSTGWIPCHLEIKTRRSTGGGAVCASNIRRVTVVAQCR